MKNLNIEWRHYERDGKTCLRCSATGKNLAEFVEELRVELLPHGIEVTLIETKLSVAEITQSNMLFFNDVPLETLLNGATVSENACHSCSCLSGAETLCRTVEYGGQTYEEIPEELIRKAAFTALGMTV